MVKPKETKAFQVTVQNHGNSGRKTIEIPKEIRDYFPVGVPVKVTIREMQ